MTNEHTSLEKYTSHTLFSKGLRKGSERVVCKRWVGDGTDCNILTPSSSDYSSTSFSFCWAAQPGVQRTTSPLSVCSWFSLPWTATRTPTDWLKLNQTVCGTRLYSFLTSTCFLWVLQLWVLQLTSTILVGAAIAPSRWYPDIFDRMHQFLDSWLGRRSICYNHPLIIFQNFTCEIIFKSVSISLIHTFYKYCSRTTISEKKIQKEITWTTAKKKKS